MIFEFSGSRTAFLYRVVIIVAAALSAAADPAYCSGLYVLTGTNGTITDHTGPDDYQDNTSCEWFIRPPQNVTVSVVAFKFFRFSTEFSYDFLRFFAGNTTTWVREYSGYELPPPFQIQASAAKVQFVSDQLVNTLGFTLQYSAGDCPAACAGRGLCWHNTCQCDPGWSGANCSTPVCAVDPASGLLCAGHGQCVGGACRCEPGYYGGACGDVYCTASGGLATMTGQSGVFADHRLAPDGNGTDYWPATSCAWLIVPEPPADSVVLRFRRFFTQAGFDSVTVFDSLTSVAVAVAAAASNTSLLGIVAGTPDPDSLVYISTTGLMRVEFVADSSWQALGWEASYDAVNCTSHCNGRGACHAGTCLCQFGWVGDACETRVAGCVSDTDCTSPAPANDPDWSPNGYCQNASSTTAVCVCSPGYAGHDCSLSISPPRSAGWPCSSQAVRTLTAPSGTVRLSTVNSSVCRVQLLPLSDNPGAVASVVLRATYFDVLPLQQTTTAGALLDRGATAAGTSGASTASFGGVTTGASVPAVSPVLSQTATVLVYNGSSVSAPLLSMFTLGGDRRGDLSGLVAPIASSGPSLFIAVYVVNSAGPVLPIVFSADYEVVYCPGNCSSRGVCRAGRCFCALGYAGADCSQPSCPGNCNGFGSCVNNTCLCLPGFFGPDCRSRFCSGRTTLTAASGAIREHVGGHRYMPNMVCEWLIVPPSTNSSLPLTGLTFSAFQIYYDGQPFSDQVLLFRGSEGNWSSVTDFSIPELGLPSPLSVASSALLVQWRSNFSHVARQMSGFVWEYTPQASCPNRCSPSAGPDAGGGQACHGTCLAGACLCRSPYRGADCSQSPALASVVQPNTVYSVLINDWNWAFFQIGVNTSYGSYFGFTLSNPMRLVLYGIKASQRGNPEFYLMNGTLPTTSSARKLLYFDDRQSHLMFEPSSLNDIFLTPGIWYVGIYARHSLGGTSTVANFSVSFACLNGCSSNGVCSPQGGCKCYDDQCWSGIDCGTAVVSCGANQVCRAGLCNCSTGWNGTNCQTPICPSPCMHGGVCDLPGHCDCSGTGYIGATCNATPVCLPPCEHNGTCVNDNVCNCTGTGYHGATCQTPVWCTPGFCQHNSTCSGTNTCACSALWTGDNCSSPRCTPACANGYECSMQHVCVSTVGPLPYPSNSSASQQGPPRQNQEMLIGLVVALSCTILGLGAIIIAILILRPNGCRRGRVSQGITAGVAGGGEET
eukprot:TRINITY_DN10685_c0_g1_i1.p1 TRINITY_DN10685_c0_g1~~TRINITY_DN10685_c0_g1_i1.p1  ORF type:complete len:1225 (+),score=375.14 TRINITY_DN10685_c0_g1_i1:189-3863(+)